MLNTLGSITKTTILKSEAHKLHHEFLVATGSEVFFGQPVKLNTAGEVVPIGAADNEDVCIGYAIMEAEADTRVTISLRGYAIIFGESVAALDAGPVKWASHATAAASRYNEYVASVAVGTTIGWNLDQTAGADEIVRILIKN